MRSYKYLIIGGGMAGDAAVRGIRELDATGTIGVISAETDPPYARPPLTKGLWKDQGLESIWRKTADAGADLVLGRRAKGIGIQHKTVLDDQHQVYHYEKLLLATGGTPRQLSFGGENIVYFRTLGDYRRLRELAARGKRFAVIGGGFIGSELAAALTINGKEVTMIFPGSGISSRMFPEDLSQFVTDYYRQKGVEVLTDDAVSGLERTRKQLSVRTRNGRKLVVDGVVAGVGIELNLDLARLAGVQIGDGIVVDQCLQTTRQDIYAAGDVVSFYNPALDRRLRVEHEDNANTMGRVAGRNMAGASEKYDHLPFFYSDLFDLGYEAVGDLDARLEVGAEWKEPFREGVLYYLRQGRVRGVLLWNVWGQVDAARELIASKSRFAEDGLRLPRAA